MFNSQVELEKSIFDLTCFKSNKSQNLNEYNLPILRTYHTRMMDALKDEKRAYKTTKLLKRICDETSLDLSDLAAITLCFVLSECLKYSESDSGLMYNVLSHNVGMSIYGDDGTKTENLQLGSVFLGILMDIGFIITQHHYKAKRTRITVHLSPSVFEKIREIDHRLLTFSTYAVPCIEPPVDWSDLRSGGFHTKNFRRRFGYFIKPPYSFGKTQDYLSDISGMGSFDRIFKNVNALQKTEWAINSEVLDIVKRVAEITKTDEIVGVLPEKPKTDDYITIKRYKQELSKYLKYQSCIKCAETFSDYKRIYFVYKCDFRGRVYSVSRDINPQGTDLSKGLLMFARGKGLPTQEAKNWFFINGANRYGLDKKSYDERIKWIIDNRDVLLSVARDPIGNHEYWISADKPVQFLAWLLEYRRYIESPDGFVSHLPVSMDGTANGLQHLTALLRDNKAAGLVNLKKSDSPCDLYAEIARKVTEAVIKDTSPEKQIVRNLWLENGIGRGVVKRSTMTTPYGVSRYSMSDFILEDYLRNGMSKIPEEHFLVAANYLSTKLCDVINGEIPSANSIMTWLKESARKIIESGESDIFWKSPIGFPVLQKYRKQRKKRVRIRRFGNILSIYETLPETDKNRHIKGISPNFIHSLDATHMMMCIEEAGKHGISDFAMIHDDFGVHAADSAVFHEIIRREFFNLYTKNNPLHSFYEQYRKTGISEPPSFGCYDIGDVLKSDYIFS